MTGHCFQIRKQRACHDSTMCHGESVVERDFIGQPGLVLNHVVLEIEQPDPEYPADHHVVDAENFVSPL